VREIYGETFDGAPGYLNSATYGLASRRQAEALRRTLRAWELGELAPRDFEVPVGAAREAFATLAGVPAATVAMGGSVSALIGLVAATVPDGTRVATLTGEFTSVSAPFHVHGGRGVTVTALGPGDLERRAGEFDVVTVSLVQSADGYVLDVPTLRESLTGRSTRVVLDVTQAMGWMRLDVGWADVVVGGSYKWLVSPRGAAWMAVRPDAAESLVPLSASWYASERPWANTYQLPPLLADDARRLDTSPAWFTFVGAGLAMPWLASLDMAAVQAHCTRLADRVREALGLPASPSAIVALEADGAEERLAAAGLRAAVRAGRVRVGFHLYNDDEDVDRLLEALRG
jgi:selenocysteine lyase/cysteine desulfurase